MEAEKKTRSKGFMEVEHEGRGALEVEGERAELEKKIKALEEQVADLNMRRAHCSRPLMCTL